jgi:Flp pilus assembly protein TadD
MWHSMKWSRRVKRGLTALAWGLLVTGSCAVAQGTPQATKASLRHDVPGRSKAGTPQEKAYELNEVGVELILKGAKSEGAEKIRGALMQDPNCTTALYNLAGYLLLEGNAAEARSLMLRAVALEPDEVSFLARLAATHFANNDLVSAAASYERVLAIAPSNEQALSHLGTIYGMQQRWEEAERTLRKAVEVSSDEPRVLANLGNVLIMRSNYADAITALRKAHEQAPNAETATALAVAFAASDDLGGALHYYEEAQTLGSTDPLLASHIEAVKRAIAERGVTAPTK